MDTLSTLLHQYPLRAGVFYAGALCGVHGFPDDAQRGHLHLLRAGAVQIRGITPQTLALDQPGLLFLPRPGPHRLIVPAEASADMVCGTVQFGLGGWNPLTATLPDVVILPLGAFSGLASLVQAMFDEAFEQRFGRQAVLDRYCELIVIQMLRHCAENGLTQGGTLAGLAHPRLAKVLQAIHEEPARSWPLQDMAALAGMSRARFAPLFREVTGSTPADYLAAWRIATAQRLLRGGRALKQVVHEVGYASVSAFHRAFLRKTGLAPSVWLKGPHPEPLQTHTEMIEHHIETHG
jgi:AraC-like DNA-binding protein